MRIHGQKWLLREAVYQKHRVIEAYNEDNRAKGLIKLERKLQRVHEFAREVSGQDGMSKRQRISSAT